MPPRQSPDVTCSWAIGGGGRPAGACRGKPGEGLEGKPLAVAAERGGQRCFWAGPRHRFSQGAVLCAKMGRGGWKQAWQGGVWKGQRLSW